MRSLILSAALLCASTVGAGAQTERIIRFGSDITINEDTSLTVTETITVYADRNRIKRGIFRDFPQLYRAKGNGFRRKRGFTVIDVTKDGLTENYVVEKLAGGKRVKIGSAGRFLSPGEHTYRIKYRTTRQLGYFDSHDELYWNVTGNGWNFKMDEVVAKITAPPGAIVSSAEAYVGSTGATGTEYESQTDGSLAQFKTTRRLGAREGISVVVVFPKGHLDYSKDGGGLMIFVKDNLGFCAAVGGLLMTLLYFLVRWAQIGKDPAAGTMVPRYEPPEGFSPAAVRSLRLMGMDDKVFGAAVIGLAAKGEVEIKEAGKTYRLINKNAPRRPKDDPLSRDEQMLKAKLIGTLRYIDLEAGNHARIGGGKAAMQKALDDTLVGSHYKNNTGAWAIGLLVFLVSAGVGFFADSPQSFGFAMVSLVVSVFVAGSVSAMIRAWRVRSGHVSKTLGALICAVGLGFAIYLHARNVGYMLAAIVPAGVLLITLFHYLMKAPTKLGRERLDEIAGFRHYLRVAEKERLNFENPPERTPELFERFLPYALALDVEQEWSESFTDVLKKAAESGETVQTTYTPSFYTGRNLNGLTTAAMATAIGSTLATNLASSSVSPSSSSGSSGYSGGGGGGFSGGGGGGGGGGGW